MKALQNVRYVSRPTRVRRLNEVLGLLVLAAGCLLLLALVSYTPVDPSFDTVSSQASGITRNWAGVVGASVADALLQAIGIAAFFLPISLIWVGAGWVRSVGSGSGWARILGVWLWMLFAPVLLTLTMGRVLWRGAVPLGGIVGRLLGDALLGYLNVPGTALVTMLMVGLSLYLCTTSTLSSARQWAASRLTVLGALGKRSGFKHQDVVEAGQEFGSKRAKAEEEAQRQRGKDEYAAKRGDTLLGGLFGWWRRRRRSSEAVSILPEGEPIAGASVWQAMPRTLVDAPEVTALDTAAAAASPYAAELVAASVPLSARLDLSPFTQQDEMEERYDRQEMSEPQEVPFSFVAKPAAKVQRNKAVPAAAPPAAPFYTESISFGRRADAEVKTVAMSAKSVRGYKLPPSSLLYKSGEEAVVREEALREEARVLVEKCGEFGVDGQVTQINPGPVVTTFEFRPDAGVKYSRVTGLADDLCLAMAAESILIERMAGKSTVGIQVPNGERETIWLRDVVECESFAQSKSKLAIALGKDINGRIVTADLAAMPHVLIAGSTGSGKSVAINAMIMSVLFKSTPEQVRMILVDPKRVELGMYEGIPHLFTPIITEAKLAANALRNAVREMERRLKLLAANHVRNIDQFNKLFDHGSEYLFEDVQQEPLPYIIIIIDELADLMMLDRSNVEESITRLAQMARAVGIHLILATQRPSVDVITGLIKANVPTRMSFRLATKVDSRTIIDSNGAESLLGRGDMLYLPPGTSRLTRVHAPFVTEKEISAVTEFWRAQGEAEYAQGFLEGPKEDAEGGDGSEVEGNDDPMFDDAVRLVFEFSKASTSLLQRRLRIGYGRAAHLIDLMEKDGLVGPADGSKPREILKAPTYYSEVDASLR